MLREALYATLILCFSNIFRVALPLPTPGGGSGEGIAASGSDAFAHLVTRGHGANQGCQ